MVSSFSKKKYGILEQKKRRYNVDFLHSLAKNVNINVEASRVDTHPQVSHN